MSLVKVSIIGSGNWGSAIAKIVGANTAKYTDVFDKQVCIMYIVFHCFILYNTEQTFSNTLRNTLVFMYNKRMLYYYLVYGYCSMTVSKLA